jgi:hypothetical protein
VLCQCLGGYQTNMESMYLAFVIAIIIVLIWGEK